MTDPRTSEEKPVKYYCYGCRQKITRMVKRANPTHKSHCATAGRVITMKKVKHQ